MRSKYRSSISTDTPAQSRNSLCFSTLKHSGRNTRSISMPLTFNHGSSSRFITKITSLELQRKPQDVKPYLVRLGDIRERSTATQGQPFADELFTLASSRKRRGVGVGAIQ